MWRVLIKNIIFRFFFLIFLLCFSRRGGGEEFIDQQHEYQLLHEDTVWYIWRCSAGTALQMAAGHVTCSLKGKESGIA
jgi:hypothetical protein